MWKFPLYTIDSPIPWDQLLKRFDWLRDMDGVRQDAEWHAEGDVLTHTKMVTTDLVSTDDFNALSDQRKHILFATALLHDVEKRSTTEDEMIDGVMRTTSKGHAKKGEKTARRILYEMNCPFEVREHICKLVRYHGLPIWSMDKDNPSKSVISSSLMLDNSLLAMFAKSDINGRIASDSEDMLTRVEMFEEICIENNCLNSQREFKSNLGKRNYFQKESAWPDYEPYDEKDFIAYLMCAIPGSGKDTYIDNNFSDIPMVSLDEIRRKNKVKRGDKKGEGRTIQEAKELYKTHLRSKTDFVYNATNITKDMRSKMIGEFEDYGAKVIVVYIEVPLPVLLKQNKEREYSVPEKAVMNMVNSLDIPDLTECYDVIYYVK